MRPMAAVYSRTAIMSLPSSRCLFPFLRGGGAAARVSNGEQRATGRLARAEASGAHL